MRNLIKIYSGLGIGIYILSLARIINAMGYFVIPYLSLYTSNELEFTITKAAIVVACTNAFAIPMVIIGGELCKKYELKKIIIYPQLLSALIYLIVAITPFTYLKIFLTIIGFGISNLSMPALDAFIGKDTKNSNKKRAFSLIYFAQNIGFGIGSIIIGILYKINPNIIFIGDALTTVISVFLIQIFLPKTNLKNDENCRDSLNLKFEFTVLKTKKKVIFIVIFLNALAYGQISFLLPLFLNYEIGYNSTIIYGSLMSINAIGVIILSPIITHLFQNKNLSLLLIYAEAAFAIGYVLYTITFIPSIFYLATIIWTIGEVMFSINFMPYIIENEKTNNIGKLSSLSTVFNKLGTVLSSLMGSTLVIVVGYKNSWFLICGVILIGFIIMIVLDRRDVKYAKKNYINQ